MSTARALAREVSRSLKVALPVFALACCLWAGAPGAQGAAQTSNPIAKLAIAARATPVLLQKSLNASPISSALVGDRLVVLSSNGQWSRVLLEGGQEGFVRTDALGAVFPLSLEQALAWIKGLEQERARVVEAINGASEDQRLDQIDREMGPLVWLVQRQREREEPGALPPPEKSEYSGSDTDPDVSLRNDTAWPLHILLAGSRSRSLVIPAYTTSQFALSPGKYRVSAGSEKPNVRPFSGVWDLEAGYQYQSSFHIVAKKGP